MKIYYRISNNSYKKNRLPHATKEYCLTNFLSVFDTPENQIRIIADNVTDGELRKFIDLSVTKSTGQIVIEDTKLNNAHSFRHCMRHFCETSGENDHVYFVEDDYLHLPNSCKFLLEGLEISDYVTLYDHPDKYINADMGGNPQIGGHGEITRVVTTKSTHWKLTNATTMTFAAKGKTLKKDKEVWEKYLITSYPQDYPACCDLIQNYNRALISCIPGMATHSETLWLTPFVDWTKV